VLLNMKRSSIFFFALGATVVLPLIYFRFTPLAIEDVSVTHISSCDDGTDTEDTQ
jgi:hypothetical protein